MHLKIGLTPVLKAGSSGISNLEKKTIFNFSLYKCKEKNLWVYAPDFSE